MEEFHVLWGCFTKHSQDICLKNIKFPQLKGLSGWSPDDRAGGC